MFERRVGTLTKKIYRNHYSLKLVPVEWGAGLRLYNASIQVKLLETKARTAILIGYFFNKK